MRKRLFCVFLMILTLSLVFFGCEKKQESVDKSIFRDGVFKLGALLPSDKAVSEDIEAGLNYAYSLANTINLSESIGVELTPVYYTDSTDINLFAEVLVADGTSAIVFFSEDFECYNTFCDYIAKTEIPVISLSPYTSVIENIYTLSVSPKYLSSCAATYALEKGYSRCAVLLNSSEEFYSDFAETYKNTLKSYIGAEPTVYFKNGELSNYNTSVLVSGSYDYLFLIESPENREEAVNELKDNGFSGEIMLTEVLNKAAVQSDTFNNCSFISKLESDAGNNVSTVFVSTFAEYNNIKEAEVSAASAYGYDAYMTIFEALKTFAPTSTGSIFANNSATEASTVSGTAEIKLSDFCDAMNNVKYFGVTDIISFNNTAATPTYIYVDNITNADIQFSSKYTFAADNSITK